jgi:hypothetical protein
LECIESGRYACPEHKELCNSFKMSKTYQTYLQHRQKSEDKSGVCVALQAFKALKKEAQSMFDLKKKQLLFDLLQNLHDLDTIDAVIEGGGVELMGSLLHDPSAQIRKYAVAVIAQLCISVKGQLHIIRILDPNQQMGFSSSLISSPSPPHQRSNSMPIQQPSKEHIVECSTASETYNYSSRMNVKSTLIPTIINMLKVCFRDVKASPSSRPLLKIFIWY